MSTEHQRRNSIERYQPKRSVEHEQTDLSNHVKNMSLEDTRNNESRQQQYSRSGRGNRRGVNSHLYANSGEHRGRGRGRGGRGRGSYRHEMNDRNGEEVNGDHTETNQVQRNDKWTNQNRGNDKLTNPNSGFEQQQHPSWGNSTSDIVTFQTPDDQSKHKHQMNRKRNEVHQVDRNYQNKPHKKNTETFKPSHKPSEMRILCAPDSWSRYSREIQSRDVLVVNSLFCDPSDLTIYDKLLEEIKTSGIDQEDLWKLWHGDSHVIADDKLKWKEACPTFHMVLTKIQDYFNMDIKATRLNWYRDSKEWKPFHHDAAAVKPDKAKTQNLTVAVSFGAERDAAFEHATTKTVISMPQPNGTIYVFAKDVNIIWRHGILQVPPEKFHDRGRISIIAWGWSEQTPV